MNSTCVKDILKGTRKEDITTLHSIDKVVEAWLLYMELKK